MSKSTRVALVRLGRNNNILFSEYIRAKKNTITRSELLITINSVLKENKELCSLSLSKKIVKKLLEIGGVDERYF